MNNNNDRQTQIIESAIQVLLEEGYANTSIGNIAKKCGVSKGVVTYYFHQKDSLMGAVLEYCFTKTIPFKENAIDGMENVQDTLRWYIESNIRFMFEHKECVKAMAEVIGNVRNEEGELIYQEDSSIYKPLIDILEYGQREGVFREFSPVIMAKMIRDVIDSFGRRVTQVSYLDLDIMIKEITDTFYFATRKEGTL